MAMRHSTATGVNCSGTCFPLTAAVLKSRGAASADGTVPGAESQKTVPCQPSADDNVQNGRLAGGQRLKMKSDMTPAEISAMERAIGFYTARFRQQNVDATKADIDDLKSEIRLSVAKNLTRMKKPELFRSYIYHTAFYTYKHFGRVHSLHRKHIVNAGDEIEESAVTIGDIASDETRKAILASIEGIKKARNRAICRAYFAGRKRSDIAREHGICTTRVTGILKAEMQGVWLRYRAGEI